MDGTELIPVLQPAPRVKELRFGFWPIGFWRIAIEEAGSIEASIDLPLYHLLSIIAIIAWLHAAILTYPSWHPGHYYYKRQKEQHCLSLGYAGIEQYSNGYACTVYLLEPNGLELHLAIPLDKADDYELEVRNNRERLCRDPKSDPIDWEAVRQVEGGLRE